MKTVFDRSLMVSLFCKDLYMPGYFDDPDADRPLLNIRLFDEAGVSVIYAFSSLFAMKSFFHGGDLETLKYMRIRSPTHFEAACELGLDLVLNPGGEEAMRFPCSHLRYLVAKNLARLG